MGHWIWGHIHQEFPSCWLSIKYIEKGVWKARTKLTFFLLLFLHFHKVCVQLRGFLKFWSVLWPRSVLWYIQMSGVKGTQGWFLKSRFSFKTTSICAVFGCELLQREANCGEIKRSDNSFRKKRGPGAKPLRSHLWFQRFFREKLHFKSRPVLLGLLV